jgi:OOP family OmpA-OmpF porin
MMTNLRRLAVALFCQSTLLLTAPAALHAQPVAAPVRVLLDGNQLKLPTLVSFATGSDKLLPDSEAALQLVKGYLEDKSYISLLRIENHSDSDGNPQQSQALSEKRALAAGRWLVGHGIDCKRLLAVGFGGTKPIASNATADGKAQNRRTLFVNAALRGRAIGGLPADGGGRVAGDLCQ